MTTDRDTRIKTHYAAAEHPELVQRLLASNLDADTCVAELSKAFLNKTSLMPQNMPVAPATSPATEAESETLAKGVIDSYYGRNTRTSPATEADTVAAGIMDSYRAYVATEN